MINIQDIIPFMKKGWVAMDKDGTWVWFTHKPFLTQERDRWQVSDGTFTPLDMFDIAPAEDWTKSLIRVGNKPKNKVFDDDEFYKEVFEND